MLRSIILRFVLPLALASAVVAYFAMPHIDQMLAEWFRGDIELRASLVEGSMEEDRKSTRLNSSHLRRSRMPSSA